MTVAEQPIGRSQEAPQSLRAHLLAVVLFIVGAVVAMVGCFLPWMTAVFPSTLPATIDTAVTRNIFSSASQASLPGVDGTVIVCAALVSIVLAPLLPRRRMHGIAPMVALLLSTVAAITVVADYLDLLGAVVTFREIYFVQVDVGIGIYITGLGAALWVAGALLSGLASGPKSA